MTACNYELFLFARVASKHAGRIRTAVNRILKLHTNQEPEWRELEDTTGDISISSSLLSLDPARKEEIAQRIAKAVWTENEGFCRVIVTLTPQEKYATFFFDEKAHKQLTKSAIKKAA